MRLDDQSESANVEDRRGGGGGIGRGSVGIGTLVIALAAGYFFGIDPAVILGLASNTGGQPRSLVDEAMAQVTTYTPEQAAAAEASKAVYAKALKAAGRGEITTEILPAPVFYFAEDYHQQYLAKNPGGYCGIGGTGVTCPIGTGVRA